MANRKGVVLLCFVAIGFTSLAAARDKFMSENIVGLLSEQENNNLLEQARLGVANATTIKTFVPIEGARNCTNLFNSYLTLTNYPLTESQGAEYAALVTNALATSKTVRYVRAPQNDTDACGIFTGFSVVSDKKNQRIYELIVYMFDWQRARASGAKGADAFIQGGVAAFVSRKLIESKEKISKQDLAAHSLPVFEAMLSSTLRATRIAD
jgi:hypothetical protein